MKAVMVMFDSLRRDLLEPYGCKWTITPNFTRLAQHCVTFDQSWAGSLPCMPARREGEFLPQKLGAGRAL